MITMEEKAAAWIVTARHMLRLNSAGPLHAVIEDGNVDDEHLCAALEDPALTEAERHFATMFLQCFTADERVAIYELTTGAS
ncbi:hypothetical protein SAMN03159338_1478 [Sphingomonas sp. NFR04]|uniref:hypothetical protein n=1 Tax=Sphingomonas sp. NFR04 TaxID=1566283 RepID=UPI0008F28058|nr:hypothetical protein [Sphingomonas sp. NFR04]SFJ47037.1 hypothetical protein SAMN03159338_1478 [Sphingomonas sp. NFR04]